MFKFCNLYSGSSGNCSFLETDNTKILVDCGVSSKKIEEALNSIDVSAKNIDAIVISHEHSDHVKGLSVFCKKYDIPIYANSKTFDNINQDLTARKHIEFKSNKEFEIGDIKVFPFSIPHDAVDPCGFNFYHEKNKVSIATDIGHVDNTILHNLDESSLLLLESNYEPDILKCSSYPYELKRRILGPNGHLSNEEAGNVITTLVRSGVSNIMLGHLSEHNNFPELAYQTVMNSIISNNIDLNKLKLSVADRYKPNELLEIG